MTQTATTITVDSLPIANSIDPVQDRVLIYTASATDIQGISRNVFLGLSSQPLGLTDSQSPQNKTFDNTNTLTIKAANLVIQDGSDTTKQAKFVASGITTGTTRSYTLPDYNATLATLAGTETLTNKTLTSPTINTPTISNASITADVLSGYTVAGSGTVYGLGIASGAFTTSNIINTAALQANSVTFAKLATAIFGGQVTSFANAGTAGGTFYYVNLGGIKFLWGQTGSMGSSSTGGNAGLTIPAFFTTIQYAGAASGVGVNTVQQFILTVINSVTSITFTPVAINGSSTSVTGNVLIIGT